MAPGTNLGASDARAIGGSSAPAAPPGKDGETAPQAAPRRNARRSMTPSPTSAASPSSAAATSTGPRRPCAAPRACRAGGLERGVIDLVADDVAGLLVQLDGRRVTAGGTEVTLATRAW